MRGFNILLLPMLLIACVTGRGEPITPDSSQGSYLRIKLGDACNYVPPVERESCSKEKPVERTFYLSLSWVSGKTPIGLPIWSSIPRANYWRENYFSGVDGGWDFYNRPFRYLPGNCVYRIPVKPGSGRYLMFLYSNTNSDMGLRLNITISNNIERGWEGEQGSGLTGNRILNISQEIRPGESLTFDFDPYDLKKYTYSIGPTPEKEEPCILEPGFPGD